MGHWWKWDDQALLLVLPDDDHERVHLHVVCVPGTTTCLRAPSGISAGDGRPHPENAENHVQLLRWWVAAHNLVDACGPLLRLENLDEVVASAASLHRSLHAGIQHLQSTTGHYWFVQKHDVLLQGGYNRLAGLGCCDGDEVQQTLTCFLGDDTLQVGIPLVSA